MPVHHVQLFASTLLLPKDLMAAAIISIIVICYALLCHLSLSSKAMKGHAYIFSDLSLAFSGFDVPKKKSEEKKKTKTVWLLNYIDYPTFQLEMLTESSLPTLKRESARWARLMHVNEARSLFTCYNHPWDTSAGAFQTTRDSFPHALGHARIL